ncbi:GAF domain-containing SpoIIE family protein phosphatase [Sphaerisporangium sp. B11E5]|uniref:PP2C family protein-serine/threonine phosphatase n=1 Tax=Sphaerisporangium sp. B11E5 TaxID=3153563 RepID=UPI00325E6B8A
MIDGSGRGHPDGGAVGVGTARMLSGLLEASHVVVLEQVPSLVCKHAAEVGFHDARVYLVDLQQDVLRLLAAPEHADEDEARHPHEMRIDTTLAGRAYQETRILDRPGTDGGPHHWWVPMLDGTERLGVLLVMAWDAGEVTQEDMRALASLVALLLVSKRSHSDTYAKLVRTRPMHVAAEMQWNLMPPLTFTGEHLAIGAALEPAYEIGGDAFDYSVTDQRANLAIFDAMGHDASAGLTASLAIAACRNNRRQGADLVETSKAIERTLIEEFGRATRFVTAILADLDITTGSLTWVNRGHHPPVVIRGGRWTTRLQCPPAHPMGLDLGLPVTLCREQLEPGDRVLFYTDGITEARDPKGHEFGLDRFVDFIMRHHSDGLPVSETLRRLIHNILHYHGSHLQDDATVLLAEWHGPHATQFTM